MTVARDEAVLAIVGISAKGRIRPPAKTANLTFPPEADPSFGGKSLYPGRCLPADASVVGLGLSRPQETLRTVVSARLRRVRLWRKIYKMLRQTEVAA